MMFETQITAGMRLLDEKMPGWHERINTKALDMNGCLDCVLGQLTGDYYSDEARDMIVQPSDAATGLPHFRAACRFGFALDDAHDEDYSALDRRYALLTAEWKAAIEKRREGGETR